MLYEVYKKTKRERNEESALLAIAAMQQCWVVPLDETLALQAGDLALQHNLPMADAIVYATAQAGNAKVITHDSHFAQLPCVEFIR